MSTSSGSAAGVPSGMTTASATAREHHWFPEPTEPPPLRYKVWLIVAQLVFFIALLGPAIVGMSVKVLALVPEAGDAQNAALGLVVGVGAFGALVGNVVFGRLSDRTTSKWGRRRIWIVAGTVVMTIGFLIVALAPNVPLTAVGWVIAQLGANATLAPFIATIADQVPKMQRGSVTAMIGIAQNVGILGGTYVAQAFADQLVVMFVGPAILAIIAMTIFAFVLPDQVLPSKPPSMTFAEWVQTFWVSPRKYPDYALAWWSRFLIMLASFMFTTYRVFYLLNHIGLPSQEEALQVVTISVAIYTVALVVVAWAAGKVSDRIGKRKVFVWTSTALFALGTILLVFAHDVTTFYLVEALMGVAYGIYIGVDLALVVDVLPNPDDAGKDLGVFNMANALPQSIAPPLAAFLLGIAGPNNYPLMLWTAGGLALIGALVIFPIKKVK